ncbi:hypothetical protein Tco_0457640 [Tanacetum coccineum]|uniref:Uncharacterized protein n=1 Tax=Tanacetum coccineum TaxID=301880 RepID=A0ABQ5AHR8_9ASTR
MIFQTRLRLVVPVFQKGDDPIDAINHMMSFLTGCCHIPRGDKYLCLLRTKENTHLVLVGSNTGKLRTVITHNALLTPFTSVEPEHLDAIDLIVMNSIQPSLLSWPISLGMASDASMRKARESKPKAVDGNTILKMGTIVIPDSDETFVPFEESHSKMLLKETMIHCFEKHRAVKGEPLATAISLRARGGLNIQLACFRDDIIRFVKELKDIFNNFKPEYLVQELVDVTKKLFYSNGKPGSDSQLNQEIFQQENSVLNQNAPSFTQLFKLSELKAQSQAKVQVMSVKEQIKSLNKDLLSHISRSCPSINNCGPQLIKVTPRKKDHESIGVRLSTSASGSQPSGNTKNDRILQTPSSNSKNKVEAHPRNVKSSLNKRNGTVNVIGICGCAELLRNQIEDMLLFHEFIKLKDLRQIYFPLDNSCDYNLIVAFCQPTPASFANLDGVDLLTGSRGDNIYTLSLGNMMASSPICLLSKASKTKSWFWALVRLSHLNLVLSIILPRLELATKVSLCNLSLCFFATMLLEGLNNYGQPKMNFMGDEVGGGPVSAMEGHPREVDARYVKTNGRHNYSDRNVRDKERSSCEGMLNNEFASIQILDSQIRCFTSISKDQKQNACRSHENLDCVTSATEQIKKQELDSRLRSWKSDD